MRTAHTLYVILMAALAVAGCRKVERKPETSDQPQRIISLGPALTQQLYLLNAGDRLVGNTTYCERPEEAKSKEKIGNVTQVNVEKIVRLEPDLVLAIGLTHPRQVQKLEDLGIRVVRFGYASSFDGMCEEFVRLGKLIGEEELAGELVKRARADTERIRRRTAGLPKKRVFVQIGAKPLFTVTRRSFVNDFIEFAGGENIAREEQSGIYSREKVVREDPEVLIIATMGIAGEKQKATWLAYDSISAVKKDQIHIMDSYHMCSPTPASFAGTLVDLVKILHPGLELQ